MKVLASFVALCGFAAIVYMKFSTMVQFVMIAVMPGPDHVFDIAHTSIPPDYSLQSSWLAHPESADNADWSFKDGDADTPETAQAYVFFIHPTAYLGSEHWNGTLKTDTATEENRQWIMVNQATVFNGCCQIYAPYYREASIHTYFESDLHNTSKALDLAYQDVERAFERFLQFIPLGSPFIIASHSQGTVHGQRLLQQVIDGGLLERRLVAAYLVGGTVHEDLFSTHYKTVGICKSAMDIHCVNAWDTWRYDVQPENSVPNWAGNKYVRTSSRWLCINPLSWRHDEEKRLRVDNPGSMPIQNKYNLYSFGGDVPVGHSWGPLDNPVPGIASAWCVSGVLRTNDVDNGIFEGHSWAGNYHSLDYALYYQSIRENVQVRINSWLERSPPYSASRVTHNK